MSRDFAYTTAPPLGSDAILGLVALSTDETIEQDMALAFPKPTQALYVTRVAATADVTPEGLAQMGPQLRAASALLPPSLSFDAVGYGCTSGTSVIGAQAVHSALSDGVGGAAASDPLTALIAACKVQGITRLALMSPYIATVTEVLRGAMAQAGLEVVAEGSFNVAAEAEVARIDPQASFAAALELAQGSGADAVFLSCTNLRTFPIIAGLEAELGLPVMASNQVLAWHMGRLAGSPARVPGRLGALR